MILFDVDILLYFGLISAYLLIGFIFTLQSEEFYDFALDKIDCWMVGFFWPIVIPGLILIKFVSFIKSKFFNKKQDTREETMPFNITPIIPTLAQRLQREEILAREARQRRMELDARASLMRRDALEFFATAPTWHIEDIPTAKAAPDNSFQSSRGKNYSKFAEWSKSVTKSKS